MIADIEHMNCHIYVGASIAVRHASTADLDLLFKWRTNGEVHHFAMDPATVTLEGFRRSFEASQRDGLVLLVEQVPSLVPLGYLSVYGLRLWDGHASVAPFLVPESRSSDRFSELGLFAFQFLFRHLRLRKVHVELVDDRLRPLLLRLGFRREYISRDRFMIEGSGQTLEGLVLDHETWLNQSEVLRSRTIGRIARKAPKARAFMACDS
jgi:hypothetical protein